MSSNSVNESNNFTWCYTWSDLRPGYDKLKLVDPEFLEVYGWALRDGIKVGDEFLVLELTSERHGTLVDGGFEIPREYLDYFHANC